MQALIRGRQARRTHLPLVRSGMIWGPPVWMKPKAIFDMLSLARVMPHHVLFDLGCGEGDVLISALRDFNIKRVVGLEIDALRVKIARRKLKDKGFCEPRAAIIKENAFNVRKAHIHEADIVTCFMSPDAHERLLPALKQECRRGAKILFYVFPGGSEKDATKVVQTVHHMHTKGHSKIYLYEL
mmetsp:Transcript_35652/g.57278  ORF Transcript_35652/g.57278 Transcript_35652/m.57278 type:complete len:184 (+) Transcript_35652:319-870(+)